jgi:hypothetical protein
MDFFMTDTKKTPSATEAVRQSEEFQTNELVLMDLKDIPDEEVKQLEKLGINAAGSVLRLKDTKDQSPRTMQMRAAVRTLLHEAIEELVA